VGAIPWRFKSSLGHSYDLCQIFLGVKFLYEKLLEAGLKSAEIVSVGTGKTVTKVLQYALQDNDFKKKKFVATSLDTLNLLASSGLTVLSSCSHDIDFAFDGADAIDVKNKQILKGLGGAFLLEKVMFQKSVIKVIVAQKEKFVHSFDNLAIPFEVVPEQVNYFLSLRLPFVSKKIARHCANGKFGLVITEKGNNIVDVYFENFSLESVKQILTIPGVLETGLFFEFSCKVLQFDEQEQAVQAFDFC
jgi:ribose 5-phosphate isomerase A